jgi:hypothetical protein
MQDWFRGRGVKSLSEIPIRTRVLVAVWKNYRRGGGNSRKILRCAAANVCRDRVGSVAVHDLGGPYTRQTPAWFAPDRPVEQNGGHRAKESPCLKM